MVLTSEAVYHRSILSTDETTLPHRELRAHSNVDRLPPNIDEARQKHKAFHTWLVEHLEIAHSVSIYSDDILVLTP